MSQISLICPYCSAANKATPVRSGSFQTDCISCTAEFGSEVILPDYHGTFKLAGQPEIVPAHLIEFLKILKK